MKELRPNAPTRSVLYKAVTYSAPPKRRAVLLLKRQARSVRRGLRAEMEPPSLASLPEKVQLLIVAGVMGCGSGYGQTPLGHRQAACNVHHALLRPICHTPPRLDWMQACPKDA